MSEGRLGARAAADFGAGRATGLSWSSTYVLIQSATKNTLEAPKKAHLVDVSTTNPEQQTLVSKFSGIKHDVCFFPDSGGQDSLSLLPMSGASAGKNSWG